MGRTRRVKMGTVRHRPRRRLSLCTRPANGAQPRHGGTKRKHTQYTRITAAQKKSKTYVATEIVAAKLVSDGARFLLRYIVTTVSSRVDVAGVLPEERLASHGASRYEWNAPDSPALSDALIKAFLQKSGAKQVALSMQDDFKLYLVPAPYALDKDDNSIESVRIWLAFDE